MGQKRDMFIHASIMLFYAIGSLSDQPSWISSILRSAALPLCFYLLGHSLRSVLKEYFPSLNVDSLVGIFLDGYLSLCCFMFISTFLSAIHRLNEINLMLPIFILISICDILEIKLHKSGNAEIETPRKESNLLNSRSTIIVCSFGLTLAFLFRNGFSWPSMPGWDIYVHLGISKWIVINNGTPSIIPFGTGLFPYSYMFHLLVASTSLTVGVDPYLIFFISPFILMPLYGLLVYFTSHHFTENEWQSLVAALIALSICGGEVFLGPQYLFPSTLSIMMLLSITIILEAQIGGFFAAMLTCVFTIICYSFYYYPLVITLPLVVYYIARWRLKEHYSHIVFLASLMGMIPASWIGASMLSQSTYSLGKKLGMIRNAYPDLLWLLFFFGGLVVVSQFASHSKEGRRLPPLLAFVASLLTVYFLPPSASSRAEIVFRSYFAIVAAVPFGRIHDVFQDSRGFVLLVRGRELTRFRIRGARSLPYIVLVLSIVLLSQPYFSYASQVPYWSNISEDEYLASEWLRRNSLSSSYVLTDPSTGWVFRGLTLRNCSTSFVIHGNMPAPEYGLGASLLSPIYDFFREEDPTKAISALERLMKFPEFVIVTTRTSAWINSESTDAIFCGPTDNSLRQFRGMSKFSSSSFTMLESWETVRIYGLAVGHE